MAAPALRAARALHPWSRVEPIERTLVTEVARAAPLPGFTGQPG